jgi:hypothetical protein
MFDSVERLLEVNGSNPHRDSPFGTFLLQHRQCEKVIFTSESCPEARLIPALTLRQRFCYPRVQHSTEKLQQYR